MKKAQAIEEFSKSPEGRALIGKEIDYVEFEKGFRDWVVKKNYNIGSFGRKISENSLEGGAAYTKELAEENGFTFKDENEESESKKRSVARKSLKIEKSENTDNRSRNNSYSNENSYSLSGKLNDYKNTFNRGRVNFNFGDFAGSPLFWAIIIIIGLIMFYNTFGGAIYDFIIGIKLKKIISWVFAILATVGILRSKNMGWPVYI